MMINSLALAERAAGELRRGVPIIIASDVEKISGAGGRKRR